MWVGCTAQQYDYVMMTRLLQHLYYSTANVREYTTRGKFSIIILHNIIVIIILFGYTSALCVFYFINKIITIIYIINAAGRPGVIGRWLYTIHGVHTVEKWFIGNERECFVITRVCWLASGRIHKLPEQTTRAHTAGSSVCVCVKNCD